ncbi:MAG: TonB-dependent receptor [Bacteroidota bacterium]|jgi:iron complex outermembrane receptor protein
MILRFFISIFTVVFFAIPARGQMRLADDDTLFFALNELVTVTATRIPTALRDAPAATDIFTAQTIAALPAHTLSDLLSLSAGTTVLDYGGRGSLKLASLRGLGGEYTLVLLNGMRLNGAQNALVDVGQLTLQSTDRIEIVRGGLASLYGSNALGGVINIVTAHDRAPLSASLGIGAFGWKQASLSAGGAGSAGRLFVDVRYEESANDFPFVPSWGGEEIHRQNAAMYRRSITTGGTLFLKDATLTLYADVLHLDVGAPGAVFSPSQGRARQEDLQGTLSLQLDMQLSERSQLNASLGTRAGRQEYRDPNYLINNAPLKSRYDNSQLFASALFDREFTSENRLLVGIESSFDQLESDDIISFPRRLQTALFTSADLRMHVAGLPLRVYPSLRYDFILDAFRTNAVNEGNAASEGNAAAEQLHAVMPSLGVHAAIMPGLLALRGRAARAFSMPTFNQLYWREGGNPSLKPEYSTAFDAGIIHTAGGGFSTAELTWFYHDIVDKIVWAPASGIYWTPRNVQHVISTGLEGQWQLQWERVSLRLNARWMSARKVNASFPGDATEGKQLIYVPEWSGSFTLLTAPLAWLTVTATERLLGPRFYTETNTSELPAHAITDAAVQASVSLAGIGTTWKLELLNVFDSSYEVVAFFPMPGRSFRFTLSTTVN